MDRAIPLALVCRLGMGTDGVKAASFILRSFRSTYTSCWTVSTGLKCWVRQGEVASTENQDIISVQADDPTILQQKREEVQTCARPDMATPAMVPTAPSSAALVTTLVTLWPAVMRLAGDEASKT